MNSDEISNTTDPDESSWIAEQREKTARYLISQSIEHAGISLEPRWFLSPYIAIWAIRSLINSERVGWWAISGDLPSDYMTCNKEHNAGDILIAFATRWQAAAERMAAGRQFEGITFGNPSDAQKLAPLLAARAEILYDFGMREKSSD